MGGFVLLRRLCLAVVLCLIPAASAFAPNWSFDARSIAFGSVGGGDTLASRMVEWQRICESIVIPLGVLQVLCNTARFSPDSDEFDLVRAIDLAASPLHFQFNRGEDSISGRDLFPDIRNATLSRDL